MVMLTRRKKFLYALSAIFSLVLIFLGAERVTAILEGVKATLVGQNRQKVQVSLLSAELQRLPVPDDDVRLDQPQTFDKEVITGATAHFQSASSSKEVLSYYSQTLSTMGWKLANSESGVNGEKFKFCKASMSLTIDVSSDGAGTKYYVGVIWTKFRRSPTYCESVKGS
jgi:hypothetical protein